MLPSHDWSCISAVPRQKNVMRCSGKGSLWLISLSVCRHPEVGQEYLAIHTKKKGEGPLKGSGHLLLFTGFVETCSWKNWSSDGSQALRGLDARWSTARKCVTTRKHLIDLQLCSLESAVDSEMPGKTTLYGFKLQRSIVLMLAKFYLAVSIVLYQRNL